MHTAAHDPQELPVRVLRDGQALVGGQDADASVFASSHQVGLLEGVLLGLVSDVTVDGSVVVDRIPDGTAAVQVVGQQDLGVGVERHVDRTTPAPLVDAAVGHLASLSVQGPTELGAGTTLGSALGDEGLVDGQEARCAFLEEVLGDDVPVGGVLVRHGSRVTLDVGHHQAADSRVFGEGHGLSHLSHSPSKGALPRL